MAEKYAESMQIICMCSRRISYGVRDNHVSRTMLQFNNIFTTTATAQHNRKLSNSMVAPASRQLRALSAQPCIELSHPSVSSNPRYAAKCSAFASSMAAASLMLCRSMDRLRTAKKCPRLLHVAYSRFSSFWHPYAGKRSGVSYQSPICGFDTNDQCF